jgi:hypothetical protein
MPGWSGQKGVRGAAKAVSAAVASWPGTRQEPHRFGGIEFLAGEREIGHLHGDRLLDVPFPRAVHDEIIAATKAEPHHIMPDSGWISFWLSEEGDVETAIAILRRSYDLIATQTARRAKQAQRARERHAGAA